MPKTWAAKPLPSTATKAPRQAAPSTLAHARNPWPMAPGSALIRNHHEAVPRDVIIPRPTRRSSRNMLNINVRRSERKDKPECRKRRKEAWKSEAGLSAQSSKNPREKLWAKAKTLQMWWSRRARRMLVFYFPSWPAPPCPPFHDAYRLYNAIRTALQHITLHIPIL